MEYTLSVCRHRVCELWPAGQFQLPPVFVNKALPALTRVCSFPYRLQLVWCCEGRVSS